MRRLASYAASLTAFVLLTSLAHAAPQSADDDDMNAPAPAPTVVVPPAPPPPPPPPTYVPYQPQQPYPQQPYQTYPQQPYQTYPQQPYPQQPYQPYPQQPYARPYAPPPPPPAAAQVPPRRVFGLGTSLGIGGIGMRRDDGYSASGGQLILGDLWIELPLSRKGHLELWIPLLNLLASQPEGGRFLWADLFYKRYIGGDGTGFFIAPGIGFMHASIAVDNYGSASGTSLQIPARIGWEFSTKNRSFGFTLAGRPWLDLMFSDAGHTATGWGALLELGFTGYWTRPN